MTLSSRAIFTAGVRVVCNGAALVITRYWNGVHFPLLCALRVSAPSRFDFIGFVRSAVCSSPSSGTSSRKVAKPLRAQCTGAEVWHHSTMAF
ncbi:hypothetical protein AKJ09_03613 [Labilithrix luteola]|uniref:Uncharacterized protein n=1 Tax=Labilithrix luteola TaxID=1391654 RepID=A0A0K1PUZ2_9BACT|nr:hypothetical protein AKJ09_03613 [Labilithrix luteola]